MAQRRLLVVPFGLTLAALVAVGCSDNSGTTKSGTPTPTPVPTTTTTPTNDVGVIDNGFESDDPSSGNSSGGGMGSSGSSGTSGDSNAGAASSSSSSSGSSGSSGTSGGTSSSSGGDSASRAIEEANIVELDGTTLYALSQYGGLAAIDVSDPSHLKLLGRHRTDGQPFEMYVQNHHAYVEMNDFGHWDQDANDGYGQWVETSELLDFDVTNPATINEVGRYDVPGDVSDSRLVGNVLYLVTFQDGYCWECGQLPSTIVTSFDVAAGGFSEVDQTAFTAPDDSYSWWQRSVSATNQRLYIGGPRWDWSQTNTGSVIQVVDISDPSGKMTRGADVQVAGMINNRWQMDEDEGVLRVISQFENWWWNGNSDFNPRVQTFTVNSSSSIVPLGQTELQMPNPESLQSVRFDGTRAYAITSQMTDPLYTVDLSVPSAPKQAATLQMPGTIFYMEPHGDRLVGFGYDSANSWSGHLAVSLFDVTNLSNPTMLSRVSFGSTGGSIDEDIDRIHKAVQVLDDAQTILVPFASYGYWDGASCEVPQSGIQIIDYTKSGLSLRGLAPHHGQPRRAMLLPNNTLLGMSDRSVTTFDITNRDNPTQKNELDLSNPAYRMVETPTHIAAMTSDWWTGEAILAFTPKANADDANASGKVSLTSLAPTNQQTCTGADGYTDWYDARLFASGTTVWVAVPTYNYDYNAPSAGRVVVATIDASNPANPHIVGSTSIPLSRASYGWGYYDYYDGGCAVGIDGYDFYEYGGWYGSIIGAGDSFVQVGNKLAYLEVLTDYIDQYGEPYPEYGQTDSTREYHWQYHRNLHVVDLSDPTRPTHEAPIALGDSRGSTPLQVMNGVVMTSRWVPSNNPGKVKFYVDRVNLVGPTTQLASVNVPGSLLSTDALSSRLVLSDYHVTRTAASSWDDCYDVSWNSWFDYDKQECVVMNRDFKLADLAGTKVSLRQTYAPPSQNIGGIVTADDRIYITHYPVYDYRNYQQPVNGPWNPPLLEQGGLWAIGGIRAGTLQLASSLDGDANWPLAANGNKVALYLDSGMAVYDTSTFTPTITTDAKLRGWGYTSYVLLAPDHAVASLGEWGLETFKW